jgi:hypothetical protein
MEQLPVHPADLERFVHPEDRASVKDMYAQAMRSPSAYRIRYRLVRPDGTMTHTFGALTVVDTFPAH